MELAGSGYLSTLAILGITFATMSAIVVVLRHTTGEPISPFQFFLTRLYIETGFFTAGFSMLPMMLADFGVPHPLIWRLGSAVLAAVLLLRSVQIPRRQWTATGASLPALTWIGVGLTCLVALLLALNAAGVSWAPGPGLYELALTYSLANRFFYFVSNLKAFLAGPA